ncbi:MAG: EAL domain-containing protein [Oscillatoriales cyanobacterium SM2_3_0]|nr:EAL domain-containing protein [Oscillatoriales cyanobacterium SM2_3_0]
MLVLTIRQLGGLQTLELKAFDQGMRLQPSWQPDSRLLVVEITETDIQAAGRWPLSDKTLAEAFAILQQHQPAVIGLDLYRDISQEPGSVALARQLQKDNVIAITNIGEPPVLPPPNVPPERVGFNDVVLDPDSTIRRQLLLASTETETLFAFSLQLALACLETQGITAENDPDNPDAIKLGQAVLMPLNPNDGGYQNIDNRGYQILLNYRGLQPAPTLTLGEVLRKEFNPDLVRGKGVLIGVSADSVKDTFLTPYSPTAPKALMPGVVIHAQMVSHLLSVATQNRGAEEVATIADALPLPKPFWFWPDWGEGLWIGVWGLGGSILIWRSRQLSQQTLVLGLGFLSLLAISYGGLLFSGWIPVVAPVLAFLLAGTGTMAYKQVHYTYHDALTGLPNRAVFLHRVEQAIAQTQQTQTQFAVLLINIDRFKLVNEGLGHQAGDQLLLELVKRLQEYLRARDLMARLGGDEFAILLENLKHPENAVAVAERIQQSLTLPFQIEPQSIFRTVSIGIAVSQLGDIQAADLLKNASTALCLARSQGQGRYQLYAANMQSDSLERLQLETDLRLALQQEEFVLYYQPIISLTTERVAGFEALIRWQRPNHGLVTSSQFISIAKDSGLILPIGQWAIQAACQQLKLWQEQFSPEIELLMGVNVSGRQFAQLNFVEQLQTTIRETGILPQSLKLEITESVMMGDVTENITLLQQIKTLGVKLSIDDFGTGFSSLSFLSRFSVNTLKIDRVFIGQMEPEDQGENLAIVEAIIALAHALNLDVVAEGVETERQLQQLRAWGCEFAQGYYFLEPLPASDATRFLASNFDRSR